MSESRRGFLFGVAAYGMWGVFPLYWTLLEPAGALEILAHRVFWSLAVMAALLVVMRRWEECRQILRTPRTRNLLALAAVVVAFNWGGYIWGVNNGHVVETSLGYFINPLVTVLMGVAVLGERLRTLQWVALALAGVAVLGLTVEYGRPPWVALLLAFSFATYGLAKKQANAGSVESVALETLLLTPVALAYLAFLSADGGSTSSTEGTGHFLLLVSTGLVTAIPLICFGSAAIRVSMTTLGLLQYLAPTIQFALGVFVFGEAMTTMRWVGFGLVWVSLAIFTVESLEHHRRQLRLPLEAAAI